MAAAYVFGVSAYQASQYPWGHLGHFVVPRLADVFVAGFAFWIGASIASFLNVVAYRMPLGRSIRGRSFCPRCHQQLASRDNVPILGWFWLRGRCRTCRLPIAARYPVVEALGGLLMVAAVYPAIYGWSLPRGGLGLHYGYGRVAWGTLALPRLEHWSTRLTIVYHGLAVVFSLALGLIRFDGKRLPSRLSWIALAVAVLPILAYPPIAAVSWRQIASVDPNSIGLPASMMPGVRWVDAVVRVITSLVVAVIIGRSLARTFCRTADLKMSPLAQSTRRLIDTCVILSVPIVVLGWQYGLAATVVATVLAAIVRRVRFVHVGDALSDSAIVTDPLAAFAITLPISLAVHLAFWRPAQSLSFYASDQCQPVVILAWGLAMLLSPLWLPPAPPPTPLATPPEPIDAPEADEENLIDG